MKFITENTVIDVVLKPYNYKFRLKECRLIKRVKDRFVIYD